MIEEKLIDILKIVSPGTLLRTVIDDILRSREGALIVIESDGINEIIEGGFKINCKLTAEKLMELSKMDGAVILSRDLKKILYANVLLIPNPAMETSETGTRHKAAERTAKQAKTLVIAISERRNKVTLYFNEQKHVLRRTEDILSSVTETLQILEKQREIYDELLTNLNVLEITNLVSVSDVSSILRRIEIIMKMSDVVRKDIIELGKEGTIVKMRLRELIKNIEREKELIIKDYIEKPFKINQLISNFSFEDLLDISTFSTLFQKVPEENITTKGYRLLSKTSLNEIEIDILLKNFKTLNNLLNSDINKIKNVLKDSDLADEFFKEVQNLKESISVGKNI